MDGYNEQLDVYEENLPIVMKKIIEEYYEDNLANAQALNQFNQTIYASEIYRFVQNDKFKNNLQNDYRRGVIIL